MILTPRQFRFLESLRLTPRIRFAGSVRGERMTQARGISIEFSDFREYSEGDDLRHLDWNVLARLGHPVTKTYRDEEDLAIYVLLDCSMSMEFGTPSKLELGKQLAASMSYIGLNSGDGIYLRCLGAPVQLRQALRGRASYSKVDKILTEVEPLGQRGLGLELQSFASTTKRTGLTIILSDGLDPGVFASIASIAARGHEIWFIQILSEEELDPELEGDLRLIDSETKSTTDITFNLFTKREYEANLKAHSNRIEAEVNRLGGRFHQIHNSATLDSVVNHVWKKTGWVR